MVRTLSGWLDNNWEVLLEPEMIPEGKPTCITVVDDRFMFVVSGKDGNHQKLSCYAYTQVKKEDSPFGMTQLSTTRSRYQTKKKVGMRNKTIGGERFGRMKTRSMSAAEKRVTRKQTAKRGMKKP